MRKILLAGVMALGLSIGMPAHASKLYIREYKNLATIGTNLAQIPGDPGTDQTPVDFSGGAASSSATSISTRYVRLICDASCSYSVTSTAGTATTTNALLPSGVIEYVGVPGGWFINVRSNP